MSFFSTVYCQIPGFKHYFKFETNYVSNENNEYQTLDEVLINLADKKKPKLLQVYFSVKIINRKYLNKDEAKNLLSFLRKEHEKLSSKQLESKNVRNELLKKIFLLFMKNNKNYKTKISSVNYKHIILY
jgi:ssRNA-specific RNase YbeY (16S rRNA maturation enzyme)